MDPFELIGDAAHDIAPQVHFNRHIRCLMRVVNARSDHKVNDITVKEHLQ
jgi:uncharacterized protein with PhoU and TrkA domain